MKKRTLSIFLAICMLLSVFPLGIFAVDDTPGSSEFPVKLTYELGSEDITEFEGYDGATYGTAVPLELVSGQMIRISACGVDEPLYLSGIIYGSGEVVAYLTGGTHSDEWGIDMGFEVPADGTYFIAVFGVSPNVTGMISIDISCLVSAPLTVQEMLDSAEEFTGNYLERKLKTFEDFSGFAENEDSSVMPGKAYSISMEKGDRFLIEAERQSDRCEMMAYIYNADGYMIQFFNEVDDTGFFEQTFTATAAGTYYLIFVSYNGFDENCEIRLSLSHATSDILLLDEALDAAPLGSKYDYYNCCPEFSEYQKIIIDGTVKSAYIAHLTIPKDTTVSFAYGSNTYYNSEVYVYIKNHGFYAQILHQNYNNYMDYGEQGSFNEIDSERDYYFIFVWRNFDPSSAKDYMGIKINTYSPASPLLETKLRSLLTTSKFYINESLTFEESDKFACTYYADSVYAKMFAFRASAGQDVYPGKEYEENGADFDDLEVLLYKQNEYGLFDVVDRSYVWNECSGYFYIEEAGFYAVVYIAKESQYPVGKSFTTDLYLPVPDSTSIDEHYSRLPITSIDNGYSVTETLDLRVNYHPADGIEWRDVDRFSSGHIKVNLAAGQRIAISAYSESDPDVDTMTLVYGYDENGNIIYLFGADEDGYTGTLGETYGELDDVFIVPKSGTYGIAYGVKSTEFSGSTVTFSIRSLGLPENILTPSEAAMMTPVTALPYSAVVTPGYDNYYYYLDSEDTEGESGEGDFGTAIKADLTAGTPVYLTAYRPDPYYDNASRNTYFRIYKIDETGKATFVAMLDNNYYVKGGERNAEFTPDTDATYLIVTYVTEDCADMEHYIGISTTATPSDETYIYNGTYAENTTPGTSPITDEFTITNDRFHSDQNPVAFGKLYVVNATARTGVHITAEGKDGPVDLRIEYFAIIGDGNYGIGPVHFNKNNTVDGKGEDVTVYPLEDYRYGVFVYSPYETDIGETVTVTVTTDIPLATRDDLLDSCVTVTEFPYTDKNVVGDLEMYLGNDGFYIEAGKFYRIDYLVDDVYTITASGGVDTRITVYREDEDGELVEIDDLDYNTVGYRGEEYKLTATESGTYYILVWTTADWRWDLEKSFTVSIECKPDPYRTATDVTDSIPYEFDYKFNENDVVYVEDLAYYGRVFKMTMEEGGSVEVLFGSSNGSGIDTCISVLKKTGTGRDLVADYDNDSYNNYGERVLFTASEAGEYYFVLRSITTSVPEGDLRGYFKSGEGMDFDSAMENNSTDVNLPYIGSFNGTDIVGFYDTRGIYKDGKLFHFTLDSRKKVTVATYSHDQYSSFLIYRKGTDGWEYYGYSQTQIGEGSVEYFTGEGEYCILVRTQNEESLINVAIEAFETDTDSHALDFTNSNDNMTGDKWEWDFETKTLTLHDGFELRTVYENAATLPADSTVVIDGAVRVTSFDGYSFACNGAFTVTAGENGGQLDLGFTKAGFVADSGNLTLSGLEISYYGYGWFCYVYGALAVNSCNIDIYSIGGIEIITATDGITVEGGCLKVVSRHTPIYADVYSYDKEVVLDCRFDITIMSNDSDKLCLGVIKSDRNVILYGDIDSDTPIYEGAIDSADVVYDSFYGSYSVDGVAAHRIVSVLTPPYSLGDVNRDGRVNSRDLLQLRLAIAGSITVDEEQKVLANVNCDKYLNARDVLFLRLIISGKLSV